MAELLDQLGSGSPPPRQATVYLDWTDAQDAAQATGSQAALLAADDHRAIVLNALQVVGQSDPVADVPGWTWQPGVAGSAPQASALRTARNEVERVARKELGVVTP
jgi:hypothetical protein